MIWMDGLALFSLEFVFFLFGSSCVTHDPCSWMLWVGLVGGLVVFLLLLLPVVLLLRVVVLDAPV